MKNPIPAIAGAICGATLMFAAVPAMAHVDVGIHIGIPGVFVQPAPVYVQPEPVYVEPAYPQPAYVGPVMYEQRVYMRPHPVYIIESGHRGRYGHRRYWRDGRDWHDADRHGHENRWEHHGGR